MLKSIPDFVARIQTLLTSSATVVEIDQAGADRLREKLLPEDWIYAAVEDDISYEVVRITGVTGSTISIDRNVENTGAFGFDPNARMSYILGTKAVDDVVEDILDNQLDVTGTGAAKMTHPSQFTWNVHVDKIAMKSDDPDIEIVDLYPTFFIIKK